MTVSKTTGCVYVVSTPIGNLEDLSPRAVRILREVALIACEDTRHTARLCQHFGIRTRRISLHAHNEARRLPQLLARVERGQSIALVSDAGTPLLQDPGERTVRAALERGLEVIPVPGPSAVLAGLVASGLAPRPFTFLGFPPRRGGGRRRWLEELRGFPGTLICFEAPNRLDALLADLFRALGARRLVVARELTKRFEEILRGRLGELEPGELRGEVTLVIEGRDAAEPTALGEALDAAAVERLADVLGGSDRSTRDAARELADASGLHRAEAYRRILERRGERGPSSGDRPGRRHTDPR